MEIKSLAVSDAARCLFPRSKRETADHLSNHFYPLHVHDGESRSYVAKNRGPASKTHWGFFSSDEESRLRRGKTVRNRIADLLRQNGRLDESHCNGEPLERVLSDAMDRAKQDGEARFVSPGLIEAPHRELDRQYDKRGCRRRVVWANFRPSLLKVTYQPSNHTWRLEVIDIKSTLPNASPSSEEEEGPVCLFDDERFKIQAYRFFIRLLVDRIAAYDHFFRRLVVSRTLSIWRYTGCYSRQCRYWNPPCILNDKNVRVEDLERELRVSTRADTQWIRGQFFGRIPRELSHCPSDSSDSFDSD